MKNILPATKTFRQERKFENDRREKGEKSMVLKLIGLLVAIVAAAILLSLIGVWWFGS